MVREALCYLIVVAAVWRGAAGLGVKGTIEPHAPVEARMWPGYASPGFAFPEMRTDDDFGLPALQAKPSVGIALGGGGIRAAALAHGWIRGLHLVRGLRAAGREEGGAGSPERAPSTRRAARAARRPRGHPP